MIKEEGKKMQQCSRMDNGGEKRGERINLGDRRDGEGRGGWSKEGGNREEEGSGRE